MHKILIISNMHLDNAVASIIIKDMFNSSYDVTTITAPYDKVEEYVNNNIDGPYGYTTIIAVTDKVFNAGNSVIFITRSGIVRASEKTQYASETFTQSAIKFSMSMNYKLSNPFGSLGLACIKTFVGNYHVSALEILYTKLGFNEFVRRFENGCVGYTESDILIIKEYESEFGKYVKDIDMYTGTYNSLSFIVAIYDDYDYKRKLGEYMTSVGSYDFAIVVNYRNQSLYITNANTDVSNSALDIGEIFCSKFSGDINAVGGKYNEAFLDFGNTLKGCEI